MMAVTFSAPLTQIRMNLLTSDAQIKLDILKELQRQVSRIAGTKAFQNSILRRVRSKLEDYLNVSPTIIELRAEDPVGLVGELGTTEGARAADQIIKAIKSTVVVNQTPVVLIAGKIFFKLTVSAVPTDMTEVLAIPTGKYTTAKGELINWIEWLLTLGNAIIISTHNVAISRPSERKYSRTGIYIMKHLNRGWRVPPAHAGTLPDNFITRAVDGVANEAGLIIKEEFDKRI
jgi:hypothetical protein